MRNVKATLPFVVTLAACAAETGDPTTVRPCDGLDTKRIAVNGIQGNGIQGNGIQGNGIQMHGVQINGVQMNGSRLSAVTLEIGRSITAVLSDGRTITLTVTASEASAERPDVILHELSYEGRSICADGTKGVFVPGVWDERGARHASDTLSTYSCVSGAIAKCVLWGYDPERVGAGLHQACTRMVRADYCGSGESFTRDGTTIDLFDVQGVQRAVSEPGFLFEAAWNESGAVCVNRPRIAGDVPSCWGALPACGSLAEAQGRGATIANLSQPSSGLCR